MSSSDGERGTFITNYSKGVVEAQLSIFRSDSMMVEVEDLVEKCMKEANLSIVIQSPSIVEQAKSNARYLYDQYRRIIPQHSLDGYKSHCWKEMFSTQWDQRTYSGNIGNMTFSRKTEDLIKCVFKETL